MGPLGTLGTLGTPGTLGTLEAPMVRDEPSQPHVDADLATPSSINSRFAVEGMGKHILSIDNHVRLLWIRVHS